MGWSRREETKRMKLSQLNDFLSKKISVKDLRIILSDEIGEYELASSKKGASMPIYLIQDQIINIDRSDLIFLCGLLLSEEMKELEISYICDTLLLSENVRFKPEELMFLIEELTDSTVNGKLKDNAREILNDLI